MSDESKPDSGNLKSADLKSAALSSTSPAEPQSLPRRKRRRVVFALSALVIAFVFVELASLVVLKVFATQPDVYSSESGLFDAHRNHRLNPAFRLPGEKGRLHSPDGFRRDTAVSIEKPAKTDRKAHV